MNGDFPSRAGSWWAGELAELSAARQITGRRYLEFLRREAFSAGLYELAAGAEDPQQPHEQDELYVVLSGEAALEIGGSRVPVRAGSVLYVAALVKHRFREIRSNLSVLVFFAPPETER